MWGSIGVHHLWARPCFSSSDPHVWLLHSLKRAAAGIGLHVNAHKTENIFYNQAGDITTLYGTPLKLVDKFTYLGSSVSSTEKDIDTRLTKAWTAIDRLSIICKSDLTDKMKRSFFQAAVVSILLYGCTTWTLTKRLEKKLDGNYTECCEQYWTSPGDNIHKAPTIRPPASNYIIHRTVRKLKGCCVGIEHFWKALESTESGFGLHFTKFIFIHIRLVF